MKYADRGTIAGLMLCTINKRGLQVRCGIDKGKYAKGYPVQFFHT